MATPKSKRDDDSVNAATIALNDAQQRLLNIENALTSPDQLGQLIANAVANSTPLRKELLKVLLEIFDDHDTRIEVEKILIKIDRKSFWRWGKYIAGLILWAATVVAAIFAYIAIHHR